jgi:thiamine pyrophosphate-dependent acetolactate synthase large subunit-like protein
VKVHSVVARTLRALGTETMFGVMGDANMLYVTDFIRDCGGRYVGAVHETGATSMADGYARVRGGVGVATVTHGPGLTNAVTALTEAAKSRTPLLVVTGEIPSVGDPRQDIDIAQVVAPTGAAVRRVRRPTATADELQRAWRQASLEQRPVVVNVPADFLRLDVPFEQPRPSQIPSPAAAPEREALEEALGAALGSRRVVVLAGRGAVLAGARDVLVALAESLGAVLATTLMAKDLFRDEPFDLGIFGTFSSPVARSALERADCILAFGASLNEYTTASGTLLAGKRVVHCDLDARAIGRHADTEVAVVGDARLTAEAMLAVMAEHGASVSAYRSADLQRALAEQTQYDDFTDRTSVDTVDVRTAMILVNEGLPTQRLVVTDAGRFCIAPWRYLQVREPRAFVQAANFGSIGLGLATAIGAAIARPDLPAVAVAGDGGLMMHLSEFSTAVREKVPLALVVLNDGAYGAEYDKLKEFGVDPDYSLIDWPELAPIAEALGGRGVVVRRPDELKAALRLVDALTGPLLIDVKVDASIRIHYGD